MGIIEKKGINSTEKRFVLGSIFGLNESRAKIDEIDLPRNMQTLPLLQAPKNIDPQVSVVNPIVIVDNTAISNENVGPSGSAVANADFRPISDQISLYTVRSGDTIEQIAGMFDVTTNTIRIANDLGSKEVIRPNQVLVILPVAGVKYIAKKGDTIAKIAKQYGADAKETANFNDVDSGTVLAVGTTIIIPDADSVVGPGHEAGGADVKAKEDKAKIAKKKKTVADAKNSSGSSWLTKPVIGAIRTQGIHGHNGVDLAAPLNTPILAAAAGTVVISRSGGWNGGYGTYVVIKHPNGAQTLYGHLNETLVTEGETVSKGQKIGKMGNTGQSTGVHLHFEVRGSKNPF